MKNRTKIVVLLIIILGAIGAYFYFTPPEAITAEQQRAKRHCDAIKNSGSRDKLEGFIIGGSVDCRTLKISPAKPPSVK